MSPEAGRHVSAACLVVDNIGWTVREVYVFTIGLDEFFGLISLAGR
jgi:hypothetical protein